MGPGELPAVSRRVFLLTFRPFHVAPGALRSAPAKRAGLALGSINRTAPPRTEPRWYLVMCPSAVPPGTRRASAQRLSQEPNTTSGPT